VTRRLCAPLESIYTLRVLFSRDRSALRDVFPTNPPTSTARPTAQQALALGWLMFLLLVFVAPGIASAQQSPIDWKSAERQINRLSPSSFASSPAGIRKELEHRGCTIPQVWDDANPHNVEQGYFTSSRTKDWIVLCSVKRISSILVFHDRVAKPFAQLDTCQDAAYLQETLPGKAGFSYRIRAISAEDIRGYCKLWEHQCPPKWLTLAGAD
jgi:hypothetical protein